LNFVWRAGELTGREWVAVTGERVEVVSTGDECGQNSGVWQAAEVVVDGERRRGTVAVGAATEVPDGAVLRVVEKALPVLGVDDRLVTQIELEIPAAVRKACDELMAGAAAKGCAARVAAMDPVLRVSLMSLLLSERMQRKTDHIAAIFTSVGGDWHQTFLTLLFASMGGDRNREPFAALAEKVTAVMVSREKGSLFRIEALLLGAAGFLFGDTGGTSTTGGPGEKDDYTVRLEVEARHLLAKYQITPLRPEVWNLSKLYPANHPSVRLAELAALLAKSDFMFDSVLGCRTSDDVERLFSATASDYWLTRHRPSGPETAPAAKSIGRDKARLVGINLVAPLMFAYGRDARRDELCERALDLLATTRAERNGKLAQWYSGGCVAENAVESQALLQLTDRYCANLACADCRVGRSEIKKAMNS
jgi:hypothetical protein